MRINQQIMSDPDPAVPVEQVVEKRVAPADSTPALLGSLLQAGVGMYAAYKQQEAADAKLEAQTQAWRSAEAIRKAREAGEITGSEAKVALSKAMNTLVDKYGVSASREIGATLQRAFKFGDHLLQNSEFDKYFQKAIITTNGDRVKAKVIATQMLQAKMNAEHMQNLLKADPALAGQVKMQKDMAAMGLDSSNPEDVKKYAAHKQLDFKLKQNQATLSQIRVNDAISEKIATKAVLGISAAYWNKAILGVADILKKSYQDGSVDPKELQQAKAFLAAKAVQLKAESNKLKAQLIKEGVFSDKVLGVIDSQVESFESDIESLLDKVKTTGELSQAEYEAHLYTAKRQLFETNPDLAKVIAALPREASRPIIEHYISSIKASGTPSGELLREKSLETLNALKSVVLGENLSSASIEDPKVFGEFLGRLSETDQVKYNTVVDNLTTLIHTGDAEKRTKAVDVIIQSPKGSELLKQSPELKSTVESVAAQTLQENISFFEKAKDIRFDGVDRNGLPKVSIKVRATNRTRSGYRWVEVDKPSLKRAFALLYKSKSAEGKSFRDYLEQNLKPTLLGG